MVFRQTTFSNKFQTRAYTLDNLVGALGGYIGLFLGYSLIQFPVLVEFTFYTLKKEILSRKFRKIKYTEHSKLMEDIA